MHFSVGAPITLATVGLAPFAGQDTSQPWSAERETLTARTDPLSPPAGHEVLDLRSSEETIDLRGLAADSGLRAVIGEIHVRLLAQYGEELGAAHVARVI